MALRVVVYAEGLRELAGRKREDVAPGSEIPEDDLGAAHVLVRRALRLAWRAPESAIRFEEPLRFRGARARGSHLTDTRSLRQLLTWLPGIRPDLAVVFVDRDGQNGRAQELAKAATGRGVDVALGVAIEDFETWLIADAAAIRSITGTPFDVPGDVEALAPREAKRRLEQALHSGVEGLEEQRARRRAVAETCDLEVIRRRCRGFDGWIGDLSRLDPQPRP